MNKEKDLEVEKVKFGKRVLKIYLVISIILSLLMLCTLGLITLALLSGTKLDMSNTDLPLWVIVVGITFLTIMSIFETILIIRALKDPRKTTLLLVLSIISLISSIYGLIANGVGPSNAIIIWDLALVIGIIYVRNSAKEKK